MADDAAKEAITKRLVHSLLNENILDNTIRGIWCEFMVAEALGPRCLAVGAGWHAWDLQIGNGEDSFPDRIRIQVKTSAKLQIWHTSTDKPTDCLFNLTYRNRPNYFEKDFKGIPCEGVGFMCDLFVLCYHPHTDPKETDQLDPDQWLFYLVPVVGPFSAVTESEHNWAAEKLARVGRPVTCMRKPGTLERGIRGRPPVSPLGFKQLTIEAVRAALGLDQKV